jgi:hypothetical protein
MSHQLATKLPQDNNKMKDYVTIFTRPNTTVMFPELAPAAHTGNVIGSLNEISTDLLVLTVVRTFETEADAIAYSQDSAVIEFDQAQATKLEGTGIQRQIIM